MDKTPKEKHLPLYGIGPALCFPMAAVSAVGIWLSAHGYIAGAVMYLGLIILL